MPFQQFSFHPKVVAGINALGYTTPTPIQAQAIPKIMAGHDLMGLAQTGTRQDRCLCPADSAPPDHGTAQAGTGGPGNRPDP